MKRKYNSFYYSEDQKIHSDIDYWKLYDLNKEDAKKKYDNRMFCPSCLIAPITVAKGRKLRYFKISKLNTNKHSAKCDYFANILVNSQIQSNYKEPSIDNIQNQLQNQMNKMMKQLESENIENDKLDIGQFIDESFTSEMLKKEQENKELPVVSLYSLNLMKNIENEKIKQEKVYFGKCRVHLAPNYNEEGDKIKNYFLQILNLKKEEELICSLYISPNVFNYLKMELPNTNMNYQIFFVCFVAELKMKGKYLNATLKDSRRILMTKFSHKN